MSTNHLFTQDQEAMSQTYVSNFGEPGQQAEVDGGDLLRSMLPVGSGLRVQHLVSQPGGMENCRIGLIPIENLNQSDVSSPILANIKSVLVLPLTWKDLIVRVRTSVNQPSQAEESVSFGAATINFSYMEATCSGKAVTLTALDFKIIRYFAKNPRRAISREELLNNVWGYNNYPSTRTVDNILLRLRHALEPAPSKPIYFLTVRGVGYKFNPSGSRD
jgi:DNA-binding winged helix-turn-helix (wHTH) protein